MQNVFQVELDTVIEPNVSYLKSYPYLLSYFASKKTLTSEDVVCGTHMSYGWMPTILDLYFNEHNIDLQIAAKYLNCARQVNSLPGEELQQLASLINNSFVGVSKLLHFVAPEHFAIWDSKVYAFVYEKKPYNYRVNNVTSYLNYLELLKQLQCDCRFPSFHASVNHKIGYVVTPMRALELIMYLNTPHI